MSANNIANAFSTSTQENGIESNTPYAPQQVVQSTSAASGVVSNTEPVNPPTVTVASDTGTTQLPNVDPAQQLVSANISSYDAQANLNIIKVENKNFQAVLNIVS